MSDARLRRLNKEIKDCEKDKTSGIAVRLVGDSPTHLVGTFKGPTGTPYEGGIYDVDIQIPQTYPFSPIKMKFITKVYHPNISSASGAICLDILKDAWSPVLTLKSTLISLQSLLCDPQPDDPQDAEVAKHYKTSRDSFNKTARYWAQAYAGAPPDGPPTSDAAGTTVADDEEIVVTGQRSRAVELAGLEQSAVNKFKTMGFAEDQIIDVLKRLNYRGANSKNISDDQVVQALLR
ncbi:hypothetical protein NliqN6_2390 [Naganishia liquefaciens]|uniref:Ubiquitin-conjugating enzyme E2 1 n=1 Tax=Naganishia liquefaciens TaxID=104408 RepID=A0A8H3YE81_9TREE|nr:hypothetical protein NliqN6_2390 [Naganishia liquefaciens]